MTPQQQAEQLARKCSLKIPPDVLEHPMPFPSRLDYATAQILRTIPLTEFFELLEAAEEVKRTLPHSEICVCHFCIAIAKLKAKLPPKISYYYMDGQKIECENPISIALVRSRLPVVRSQYSIHYDLGKKTSDALADTVIVESGTKLVAVPHASS